jgi:hypothetical protein
VFTETKSRIGWRTGASRFTMKQQLESLQSFDPAERARAGQQLVELGLNRCAEALLDHVANEFDNRVLGVFAAAVVEAPPEPKESRKAQQLREWAAAELERSALEEAFMGGETDPVAFPPEPDFHSAGLEDEREPLPVRVPVAAVAGPETALEPIEYRFEVPEPAAEAEPIEYRPTEYEAPQPAPEPVGYRFEVPEPAAEAEPIEYRPTEYEAPQPAPEPVEYRFEGPAPVAEYPVEAPVAAFAEPAYEPAATYEPEPTHEPAATYEPEPAYDVPPFISWRPPADGGDAGNGNGNGAPSEVEPAAAAPPFEAHVVEEHVDAASEPAEYRFDAPAPIDPSPPETVAAPAAAVEEHRFEGGADNVQEHRFEAPTAAVTQEFRLEAPEPNEPDTETSTNAAPRTLAERLRARDA